MPILVGIILALAVGLSAPRPPWPVSRTGDGRLSVEPWVVTGMTRDALWSSVLPVRGQSSAVLLLLLCGLLGSRIALASAGTPGPSALEFLAGTWTGTSTCVGDRPACRNETVVYRFVPLDGQPHRTRLLADKIIDGRRVAMGALACDVDEPRRTARCEFTVGRTHGVWSYAVTGDSMTGRLVILPEGVTGRDVTAHRASEGDLPPAPPPGDYDE